MFISALIKKKKKGLTQLLQHYPSSKAVCVQGNYVRFAAREEGEDDFCFVAGAVEENKGIKGRGSVV